MTETRIASFIVRFVQPESGDQSLPWHGVVRHVQSRQEIRFTQVQEALQFMSRYVLLEQGVTTAATIEDGSAPEDKEH